MTIFIHKKVLKLVGVTVVALGLVAVQMTLDPIGHYQQAVAKRAEMLRQQQATMQAKAQNKQAKAQNKQDKSIEGDRAQKANSLHLVDEAEESILTSAKALKAGFFTEFRLERDRVRDQQLQLLKELISNPKTGDNTRHDAQDKMLSITQNLGKELEVENLIKAKNYEDAVVFLQEKSAVVVIKAKKLQESDVMKIADLVQRASEISENDIIVIPKE